MATNTKIRTEDVVEILDTKIKASSAHPQLDVAVDEFYNSVLAKIAARSPTLDEKEALDNTTFPPSITNPFVTLDELALVIEGSIPWKTIGPIGSGADFVGNDETPFVDAFATSDIWFFVLAGTYTFTGPVTIPVGIRLVGAHTSSTILASASGGVFSLSNDVYISYMNLISTDIASPTVTVAGTDTTEIQNCMISATPTSQTVNVAGATNFTMSDTALFFGTLSGVGLTASSLSNVYVDTVGVNGIYLDSPTDVVIWGSTFQAGTFTLESGTNIRVVGNHFSNAISNTTPIDSVIFRANTPNTNNNEDEALTALLQYLGSPSALQNTPSYSNNFAGPQAQNLTARASALDLLIQWKYEERNFSLIASAGTLLATWTPSTNTLSTSGAMYLISAHRDARWVLPEITPTVIPDGEFLYYVLDRSLSGGTGDITLTAVVAPIGSFPLETNPPGSPSNRQIITLAFNHGGTLWWRGGGGTRFPSGAVGQYFVDGTSKNILTYLGALDYNDSDPNYSHNFAGAQGESLTVRLSHTDTLIKRLFEHSNLSHYLADASFMSSDAPDNLTLTGTLYFTLPNKTGTMIVNPQSWTLADGEILYFSWDHTILIDQAVGMGVATTVPLPDENLDIKYFVAAKRHGDVITLWDGTRLPEGCKWPVPKGRQVVPTGAPTLKDNIVWDGTNILWEKLAIVCDGISLNSNLLTDQVTPSAGLTDLVNGEGLLITHTWLDQSPSSKYVTIEKTTLPLPLLESNQFLWVQNRDNFLIIT